MDNLFVLQVLMVILFFAATQRLFRSVQRVALSVFAVGMLALSALMWSQTNPSVQLIGMVGYYGAWAIALLFCSFPLVTVLALLWLYRLEEDL